MAKHKATSKQSYAPPINAVALETKIEVVRVQLDGLERKVDEGQAETRRWREEIRVQAEAVRQEVLSQAEVVRRELASTKTSSIEKVESEVAKHVVQDDHFHGKIEQRVERVENQGLEHGKMVVGRLEDVEKILASRPRVMERLDALEKAQAADEAVDKYKKWLIVTIFIGGLALLLNAVRLFEPFVQYFLRHGTGQ